VQEVLDPLLRRLIHQLENGSPLVAVPAARALGQSRDPVAAGPLLRALREPNRSIQIAAVEALGELGAVAVEPLRTALRWETNALVREVMASLLEDVNARGEGSPGGQRGLRRACEKSPELIDEMYDDLTRPC
jgi:HEAT repeat protein